MTRLLLILFLLSSCGITAQAQWGSPRNCRELNSVTDDFAPVWNTSQHLLYMNSERTGRSLFYIASRNSPTQFSPPAILESPLNAKRGNQSYLTVSATGSAYLSCFTLGDDRPYLSIFHSEQVGSVWKQPAPVEELADESFGAHPTVSKDGLTLIFASNREGGSGGIDLWITRKQNDGKWSQPLNLGESINSTGNEITPFLIGDSLYLVPMAGAAKAATNSSSPSKMQVCGRRRCHSPNSTPKPTKQISRFWTVKLRCLVRTAPAVSVELTSMSLTSSSAIHQRILFPSK
jgi:hypothetical protein